MDFRGIKSLTVEYTDLLDLNKAGNPLAEEQVPEFIREAIAKRVPVFVKASEFGEKYKLSIEGGKFVFSRA
jgi:hypothetical protein